MEGKEIEVGTTTRKTELSSTLKKIKDAVVLRWFLSLTSALQVSNLYGMNQSTI